MAARSENSIMHPVTSPFLKHPEMEKQNVKALRSEQRERRKSFERIELLNLEGVNPVSYRRSGLSNDAKLQGKRFSRDIAGVHDRVVTAADSASPSNIWQKQSDQNNFSLSNSSLKREGSEDDDGSSVIFGGSVASTIPDRYGFTGGVQYTHENDKDVIPVSVIRRREWKWLQMLEDWDKYMAHKYKKVRDRCRKGIPTSIRPRAWLYLCGGSHLMNQNKGIFDDLLSQPGDPRWLDDIRKDLHRQFPMHEMFADPEGPGQKELFRVLKAYSILNPDIGYFQGQAPVAAMLVMHMPAEQAFWCLVAISERYLPGYYSQGLEAVQIDGDILVYLLKKISPSVYRHLSKQKLDPILYMMEWFMCIYTRTLPWSSVLRVWDIFFCEGVKVLFRVGLVLLKGSFMKSGVMKQCPTMFESMDVLRHLNQNITEERYLIGQLLKLQISEEEMERIHHKIVEKRKANQSAEQRQ